MSKVSFRARQIDFNKPLPILRSDSELLSEISENALVNRGVPSIPSGMEKEEENEHHFVEVLNALQTKKSPDVCIPVPEIYEDYERYNRVYAKGFVPPNQFIHIRTVVLAEEEPVEYDMDSDDEEWLKKSDLNISEEKFESMIDKLERGCGKKVMNLEEAKILLQDDPSLVIAVYDYWLNKRVQCRQPLILSVRQEKRDMSNNNDPYIAFRRRTERMQTRKNRKNDENSYEKMLLLREQFETLGDLLLHLVHREMTKENMIKNERNIFNVRHKLKDYDGSQMQDAEVLAEKNVQSYESVSTVKESPKKRLARKRKVRRTEGFTSKTGSSEELTDDEMSAENRYAFVRLPGCQYQKPIGRINPFESSDSFIHPCLRYTLTTVPSIDHPRRHSYTGYVRKRVGRGGRVILDRISTPFDEILQNESSSVYSERFSDSIRGHEDNLESLSMKLYLQSLHLKRNRSFASWKFNDNDKWECTPQNFYSSTSHDGNHLTNCPDKMLRTRSKFDDRPPQLRNGAVASKLLNCNVRCLPSSNVQNEASKCEQSYRPASDQLSNGGSNKVESANTTAMHPQDSTNACWPNNNGDGRRTNGYSRYPKPVTNEGSNVIPRNGVSLSPKVLSTTVGVPVSGEQSVTLSSRRKRVKPEDVPQGVTYCLNAAANDSNTARAC